MNFDSIEGLMDNEIAELYDNINAEGPMIGATYQVYECLCTTYVTAGDESYCASPVTTSGLCGLSCDTTQVYTDAACRAKCTELCGPGGSFQLVHTGASSRVTGAVAGAFAHNNCNPYSNTSHWHTHNTFQSCTYYFAAGHIHHWGTAYLLNYMYIKAYAHYNACYFHQTANAYNWFTSQRCKILKTR